MSATEVILLQRIVKLGQMGDIVKVKPGYARNYLLPQGKAIRATAVNRERFERERSQLEAQNIKHREEAERLLERLQGISVTVIRQAGESGNLYGSVTARDISENLSKEGLSVTRQQVEINHPIKMLGLYQVKVQLHPEIHLDVKVNVARSAEEAERQAAGEVTELETSEVETVENIQTETEEDSTQEK